MANCDEYGSQKQRAIANPNTHADAIMYVVNKSERRYCMCRASARQSRQIRDAADQYLQVAQQR